MTELPKFPEYHEPYSFEERSPLEDEHPTRQPVYGPDLTDSGLIAQVRRAFRDTQPNESVSTDGFPRQKFVTYWQNPTDMNTLWAIGYIGKYNRFDPEYAQWVVSSLNPDKTRVAIAREGSPALYFWTVEPNTVVEYLKRMNNIGTDYQFVASCGPDELSAIRGAQIYPTSARYGAPESLQGEHVWLDDKDPENVDFGDTSAGVLIRAWWD